MRLSAIFLCLFLGMPLLAIGFGQKPIYRIRGELFQVGETKFQVTSKLGNPNGTLRHQFELLQGPNIDYADRSYVTIERWFYNFGSRRLTQTFVFRDGRLETVEEGDYGFDMSDVGNCSSTRLLVNGGDISPKVAMICGEPDYIDTFQRQDHIRLSDILSKREWVSIEEWTYNHGPRHPLTVLTFENGVLVDIANRDRGF